MLRLAAFVIVCALIALAALPVDDIAQIQLSVGILLTLLLLRPLAYRRPPFDDLGRFLRILFIVLALLLSIRYFWWRTYSTLPTQDIPSLLAGLLLYGAELFAFVVMVIGAFVSIHPLNRPILPMPDDRSTWPTVDVLVPTYNESDSLLETTLIGALGIDYPANKLRIHLLDDGSTRAKRTQSDPARAREACERHRRLKKLCARLGVRYLTREHNESAKAGNLNHALGYIQGDLILVLDADHIPTRDILTNTVGWLIRDPGLFLVQSPHFFVTPDPIEKNLKTFQQMPSEQEMFYTNVQRGMDFWNASFFCGAAAVLRRRHLDEIGGLSGQTITEDAETALALHARGYRSAYIWRPMIAGLQPENFISFVKQRTRWAQGMTQLLILSNPLRIPGLSWWQRLAYLNSMLFWSFPFARIVFLCAPLMYLFLGLGIYNASIDEILILALPHVLSVVILSDYLYGNARWVFVSEFYEQLLALFLIKPLFQVLRSPHHPQFEVTAKGETLDQDHISPLIRPLYSMIGLTTIGLAIGVWRYFESPWERDTVLLTMTWATINLTMLLGSLGALVERQQRRVAVRIPCRYPAQIQTGGRLIECETEDLSVTGIGLILKTEEAEWLRRHPPDWVRLQGTGVKTGRMGVRLQNIRSHDETAQLGLLLIAPTLDDCQAIVSLAYSGSERWRDMLRQRNRRVGVLRPLVFLFALMFRYLNDHLRLRWQAALIRMRTHFPLGSRIIR